MDAQQWVLVESFCYRDGMVSFTTVTGTTFQVRCKIFRETWTSYDPERENQKVFDPQFRRKVW